MRHRPRVAAIGRMQHARGGGADPDVIFAERRDVRAACGVSAFGRQCGRKTVGRNARPCAAVRHHEDRERAVDRIAERHAAILGPEGHRVEEYLRILVGELERPRLPGVGGLVDARRLTVADAEDVGGLVADRVDIPEVERLGAWNPDRLPRIAAVGRPQNGSARAAGPRNFLADRTDPAQSGRHAGELCCPRRGRRDDRHREERRGRGARCPDLYSVPLHFATASVDRTGSPLSESADHNIVTAV